MNITLKDIPSYIIAKLQLFGRYKVVIFVAFVAILYGYIIMQINSASHAEPTAAQEVSASRATPHIDEATIQKLQQLQDNSVSVKALFNNARTDPFQ